MKIAMITPEFPQNCGGIGYYVFYLSRELKKAGFNIFVFMRSKEDMKYTFHNMEVKAIGVPGIPPFNNFYFKRRLNTEVRKNHFDIAHIHSASMPKISKSLPSVVTSHCCIKENTHSFYRPIKDLESLYRNLMHNSYCRIEENLVKSCDRLTVVSDSMRDDYRKAYGVDSIVVYNGVDLEIFLPLQKIAEGRNIIYCGSLKRGKGILDLLKAVVILNKKYPDFNYHIYGHGPLRSRIAAKIKREHLANVFLHAPVNHSNLAGILGNSSLFVLPSYYEGLSNSILEAMACELPVVASNVKGNAELVRDNFNGFLFERGNSIDLAQKIEVLLQSPLLRTEMGKNGRRFVSENFTWDKVVEKFMRIYNGLI